MSDEMTDNKTEAPPAAERTPENAEVVGSAALPQDELNKLTDDIIAGLKTVYDPEIPADVYEIGLIYKIDIGDDRAVKIDMSLTSPNCPSAQELPIMIENAVSSVPGVKEAKVTVVWDPPWDPSRMSDEARLVLNMW
jgi:FeS assembly SUF system protein